MSDDPTDTMPAEIYWSGKEVPMDVDLFDGGYSLISYAGANQRNWLQTDQPLIQNSKIKDIIKEQMRMNGALKVKALGDAVQEAFGNAKVSIDKVHENIFDMVRDNGYALYKGDEHLQDRPDSLIMALEIDSITELDNEMIMISGTEMSIRNWFGSISGGNGSQDLSVECFDVEKIYQILGKLGSLYNRGKAKSVISELDIAGLKLPDGGRVRFSMENISPKDARNLDELFADIIK